MLENMHDLPYQNGSDIAIETTAAMASLCTSVRTHFPHVPLGVQVLKSGNTQALAVAKVTGIKVR